MSNPRFVSIWLDAPAFNINYLGTDARLRKRSLHDLHEKFYTLGLACDLIVSSDRINKIYMII